MPADLLQLDTGAGGITAHGSVAQRLLGAGMNINALRPNNLLREDEWRAIDGALLEVARERLPVVRRMLARNMRMNLTNALGTMVVTHERSSEMTAAEVSMDGATRARRDLPVFDQVHTPIPLIHHEFRIGARHLAASRTRGEPLDTTAVREATRQVVELTEDIVINGRTLTFTGAGSVTAALLGMRTHSNRNTVSLAANWDASAASHTDVVADVLSMKQASINDRYYGPWFLLIPTAYETILDELYTDGTTTQPITLRARLAAIDGILDIIVADKMTANNVVLIQATADVMDLIVGFQPRVVFWESPGSMEMNFKVMSMIVPRPKADIDGRSGIIHLS